MLFMAPLTLLVLPFSFTKTSAGCPDFAMISSGGEERHLKSDGENDIVGDERLPVADLLREDLVPQVVTEGHLISSDRPVQRNLLAQAENPCKTRQSALIDPCDTESKVGKGSGGGGVERNQELIRDQSVGVEQLRLRHRLQHRRVEAADAERSFDEIPAAGEMVVIGDAVVEVRSEAARRVRAQRDRKAASLALLGVRRVNRAEEERRNGNQEPHASQSVPGRPAISGA
jgi:hypothetical protein